MNLEETLDKIVELSREELGMVRKRSEEKTAAREHGHDFHEMQRAADRLDHYAHQLRRLHDAEFGQNWRHESLRTRPAPPEGRGQRPYVGVVVRLVVGQDGAQVCLAESGRGALGAGCR